ncbi:uncharacterized protein PV07_03992 [Cladophialophora immunda]|uniref:BCAS3 domain-containing protein n=1 Tax=Cladophialophora immunda TaxID=569365 RepID=A0A0D2CR46_9EURO|nr:uncharacterized protein PV07_03992 [Cladophialophora immunda]KIW32445.1 hypothetical protein PV07_03992 [Cladophialophora immunda]OQV04051.1 hypothetical protein CLAIMM_09000 [Cladophialophora immunda]
MPASNKPASVESRNSEREGFQTVVDQDPPASKAGKRKTKNAAVKQLSSLDHAEKTVESMGQSQQPPVSSNPPSILGQLPQTFPSNRKISPFDVLNDANASQKVSDEHTPPADNWARSAAHGRTPPIEPIPGLNTGGSPPYEPGFSSRGVFNSRSPPISPPLRKARPVSYSSAIPPLPTHSRISTSPYGYGMTAYGSPPAPPHLPQQHFYGPHDVDLGLHPPHTPLPEPVPLKFGRLPGSGNEFREAALLAVDGELHVVSYNGEKMEHVGALSGVQGTILDASLLTWNTCETPFADYRPLVALTIFGPSESQSGSPAQEDRPFPGSHHNPFETKVVIFSVSKGCQVAELLRVQTLTESFPGVPASISPAANLKVYSSGNFLVVASGDSGEMFVFSIRQGKESAVFECLGKYWTTIQPQLHRRDSSSHGPGSDADVSPADLGRGPDSQTLPILSLNGRWLSFCPASTPSRRSIGAILGDYVVHNKNSNITAGTAPSRPLPNCDVESPDVDTFLSKVAKGFAQEAVRGAKWISEKGMQTWQSYWKRDTASTNMQAAPSSSPPVYPPQLGLAQFPPTHAIDQQGMSKDPDLVTIIDLKLLQDNHGRKPTSESSPMITFQPPGGCSFLSFMPTGLGILTANRKGDVQYIWDLMQIKHVRVSTTSNSAESGRVRQIARYERLSPSSIVDVAWDGPTGCRFAILTKNRTIHLFDLPKAAFQWPPPPTKKHRPTSAPVDPSQVKAEHDPAPPGGFFASAMSIAGRTQPMLASLRGRAPSINSGMAGMAPSGIGFASTTTIKSGSRAVAAGLSKSLGAATETVTSIRHANQSRLHLKIPARVGIFCWLRRDGKPVLSILDESNIKNYYVRMTKPRENRQMETVSVFDARRAVAIKLPKAAELAADLPTRNRPDEVHGDGSEGSALLSFWKVRPTRDGGSRTPHPLASAEIETNAPYQPFHSDRRVTISLFPDKVKTRLEGYSTTRSGQAPVTETPSSISQQKWVFGDQVLSYAQNISSQHAVDEGSIIYRETTVFSGSTSLATGPTGMLEDEIPQAVSNTKKKKGKKNRAQARLFEHDNASDSMMDFAAQDAPFEPDEDLLRGDSPP